MREDQIKSELNVFNYNLIIINVEIKSLTIYSKKKQVLTYFKWIFL
jgi:hypothetical protein